MVLQSNIKLTKYGNFFKSMGCEFSCLPDIPEFQMLGIPMKFKISIPILLVGTIIAYVVISALVNSWLDDMTEAMLILPDEVNPYTIMEAIPDFPFMLKFLSVPILSAVSASEGEFPLWAIFTQSLLWGLIASFFFAKK